jgi:1,4-dihydroxy-2-naphthoate octaprenyltransferase
MGLNMSLARHGSGATASVRALASQIHPVFMLPPVAASLFGAALAGEFSVALALLHASSAFFALYTAHVKDGYVDFYGRGEDDDHPLTAHGCRVAMALSTAGFAACLLALGYLVGPLAAAVTLPGWLIGYFHAPQLDTNPVGATAGYPGGIALATVGGFYVQAETVSATVLGFAAVFLVILSGIKVIDDAKDYDYDRSIAKRTVAVVLGVERAHHTAYALMGFGLLAVIALSAAPVFPRGAALATLPFAVVAVIARRAEPELATMLLVRGSYLFLAVLVAVVVDSTIRRRLQQLGGTGELL